MMVRFLVLLILVAPLLLMLGRLMVTVRCRIGKLLMFLKSSTYSLVLFRNRLKLIVVVLSASVVLCLLIRRLILLFRFMVWNR